MTDGRAAATRLRGELDDTLGRLLPSGARVALINYPNHHNVGDPALYLGTLRTLRRLGIGVAYACEQRTYSRQALFRQLRRSADAILINGGGNLGDQYPQQAGREQVLVDFPDVPTIQLPQSIWFTSPGNRDAFARIVSRHRNLTLLLRDSASLEEARNHLAAEAMLCPDLAFGLGPIERPSPPTGEIVWLRRVDRESADRGRHVDKTEAVSPIDWLTASPDEALGGRLGPMILRLNAWLARRVKRYPALWRPLWHTFEPLARRRVQFGCALLSRGHAVVTDRLHGVILSMLMDIPVVAVDTSNGKVSSFIETWLAGVPGVQMAPDHTAGLDAARRLLGHPSSSARSG